MTFRGKLLLVFSLIGSSGVFLSSLLTYGSARKRLGSAAKTEIERTAALIARQSETTLDIFRSDIRLLAQQEPVRRAGRFPSDSLTINRLCGYFQEIVKETKVYQSINLHDRNARCIASSFPDRVGLETMQREVARRPGFRAAMEGETFISQIFLSGGTGRPVIAITAPVKDGGEITAAVRAVIDLDYFNDYVLSPQGYVHGGKAYFFDPQLDTTLPEGWKPFNVIESGAYVKPDIPIPQEMLPQPHGFIRYPSTTGTQLAAFSRTARPEWFFVVEKPQKEVVAPIRAMGRMTAATLVSTLCAVTAAACAVAHPLLKRLGQCMELAREIEAGRLDQRLTIEGTDEVARLGKGLNTMAQSLEDSHAALREAERTYRGIFENAVEGIFVTSAEGRLLNANPALVHLLGYDEPAKILGTNIAVYYPGNAWDLLLKELRTKGIVRDFEIVFMRRDGTQRTGIVYARADRDSGGKLVRIQGILNDITEQKEVERERYRAQEAQRKFVEAQLMTLRYQINPHFLFNVLNSLDALSKTDPARITELIRQLSRYLRSTLSPGESGMVPVVQEMSVVESYLNLEKVRFEEDLVVSIDASEEVGDAMIPELLIQPVVENAVKHGMKTSPAPLRIDVACMAAGRFIRIDVSNSGKWILPDDNRGGTREGGLGLENIRTRLKLTYGDDYRLNIGETDGRVKVTVEIPRRGEENATKS